MPGTVKCVKRVCWHFFVVEFSQQNESSEEDSVSSTIKPYSSGAEKTWRTCVLERLLFVVPHALIKTPLIASLPHMSHTAIFHCATGNRGTRKRRQIKVEHFRNESCGKHVLSCYRSIASLMIVQTQVQSSPPVCSCVFACQNCCHVSADSQLASSDL